MSDATTIDAASAPAKNRAKASAKTKAVKTAPVPPLSSSPSDSAATVNGAAPAAPGREYKARIEHNIPGRIRMKIPSGKTNPKILDEYVTAFSALPGVAKVKAKPETGSIVIHYDTKNEAGFAQQLHHCCQHHALHVDTAPPEDDVNRMANKIQREAEFLAEHSPLARHTVDFFKAFDRELKLASNNTIDMKIFLAGGLAAFTFLEIGAAAATPMWVTLGLFGVNHFVELQATPPTTHGPTPPQAKATPADQR